MTLDASNAALLAETIAELERRLGRSWSNFDTLPVCPECGAPMARGRVGGVLCIGAGMRPRRPHARRLAAWEKTLRAAS